MTKICCGECHTHPCPSEAEKKVLRSFDSIVVTDGSITLNQLNSLRSDARLLLSMYNAKCGEVELLKAEINQLKRK